MLADQSEEVPVPGRDPLFAGDTGTLSVDTRRVLVNLLLGPFIEAEREPNQWAVLLRDEDVIRSRLADLFLSLEIDRAQKVAFTRQMRDGDLNPPILLRSESFTFLQSVLVLFLRQRLTSASARGDRAIVEDAEMQEHLKLFEGKDSTDHSGFAKRMKSAIDKAKAINLIRPLRGEAGRFEVSPTLKILFPAEDIQRLSEIYKQIANGADASTAGDAEAPEFDQGSEL
jgi:hypothetical protein